MFQKQILKKTVWIGIINILGVFLIDSYSLCEYAEPMIRGAVLFEFSVTAEPDKDNYYQAVRDVVMSVLRDEIERSPAFRSIVFMPKEKVGNVNEQKFCKENGYNFFINGEIRIIRDNASIKANWMNLDENRMGSQEAYIGFEDLKDFGRIADAALLLSEKLVDSIQDRTAKGSKQLTEILVGCFSSEYSIKTKPSRTENTSYFGQFIAAELSLYLNQSLKRYDISQDALRLRGMSFDEYKLLCSYDEAIKTDKLRSITLPRYILAGTIIIQDEDMIIKPLLSDGMRKSLSSLDVYINIPLQDLDQMPKLLAGKMAKYLIIAMVQEFLKDEGLYLGFTDGVIGSMTKNSIVEYQKKYKLTVSGELNPETLAQMGFLSTN